MADTTDTREHHHDPPRFDGAPHCTLCTSRGVFDGHEWCEAAHALVCDECCRRLLTGDARRLMLMGAHTGTRMDIGTLFTTCIDCERGHRHVTERILIEPGDGDAAH